VTRVLAAVRWSRSVRRLGMLGSCVGPDRTDKELASEDVNGELVILFWIEVWSGTRLAGLDHAVSRRRVRRPGGRQRADPGRAGELLGCTVAGGVLR
jgi:hypothetical protein